MQIKIDRQTQDLLELISSPAVRAHFSQPREDCLLWHYFHTKFYEGNSEKLAVHWCQKNARQIKLS